MLKQRGRHLRQPAPAPPADGARRTAAGSRQPACDTRRRERSKPLSHTPPRVAGLLPALGLDATSAAGLPGSSSFGGGAWSAQSRLGWALSRPRRPGRRPRPGPAKLCPYWLLFPPFMLGPAPPGASLGPSRGEPPPSESCVSPRTLSRNLGTAMYRPQQVGDQRHYYPADASNLSSFAVAAHAVRQTHQ